MFSIGGFAQAGRVSARMLRHYDAIGLLRPAHIQTGTGYRSYEIVALKDLGFTLQQVRSIIADKVTIDELRAMLRRRRAEVTEQIAADTLYGRTNNPWDVERRPGGSSGGAAAAVAGMIGNYEAPPIA